MDMKMVNLIAMIVLIVGGLNWGLVGLVNLNVVALVFGATTVITRLIYIIVGAAAVYEALVYANVIK